MIKKVSADCVRPSPLPYSRDDQNIECSGTNDEVGAELIITEAIADDADDCD